MTDSHLVVENEWNPKYNHKAISIIQQEDGNWKGWMYKHEKLIEVRQIDPQAVLQALLTHP